MALDDFGTSYSSLAYFRRLPVQLIKVDRAFVRDMLASEDDRPIVESIVFSAKRFAMSTSSSKRGAWTPRKNSRCRRREATCASLNTVGLAP